MSTEAASHIRLMRNLRAVREYTPDPVPDDALRDILEVGRWSGSASNRQPTEIVVVRDSAVLKQIGEHGVRAAATAPLALVIVTPGNAEQHDLEVFDLGRLVERLLLAAKAHGLGSNISTLKGEGPDVIKKALGIPAEKGIWTVVTIGKIDRKAYRARARNPNAGRKPGEQFAHWDRY